MNKLKVKSLQLAHSLLAAGRQPDFVKKITGITIVEMVRQKWAYELKVPHPDGYRFNAETGKTTHDGRILNTGQYRSVFGQPSRPQGKSNKQMKRENRKAFFDMRRGKAA